MLQQGYDDQPFQKAEQGYKDSVQYIDLNWKFRVLFAEAHIRKRQHSKALELLDPEPPPSVPGEVAWRRKLIQAFGQCQLHRYPDAEERFGQAEALAGNQGDRKADLAYFRGRCEMAKGQWNTAEKYFRAVIEPGATSDAFLQNYSLVYLGWCARHARRFEESIDWYKRSLPGIHSLNALPLEEQSYGNLGFLYAEIRDFPNAGKNTEAAEKIASRLNILQDEQLWLLDLGNFQQIQGQSGAAEASYQRALAIARQLGNNQTAVTCLRNLTGLKLKAEQLDAAAKYSQEAKELAPTGENLLFWQLNDATLSEKRGAYAAAENTLRTLLQQVEPPKPDDGMSSYRLIWAIQLELARASVAQKKFDEAEHWFQSSIATMEKASASMQREVFRTAMLDNIPVFDDYVAFLVSRKQTAKALQIAQMGRAKTLMQGLGISEQRQDPKIWLAKVQSFLRQQKAVILSYFASENECYLWTITPTDIRLSPLGIRGPDLDSLIGSYRQEILNHFEMEASPSAKKLFQVLVQPASDLTPKGTHVIIVADSRIYSVNFETLIVTQGAARYWIDDVDVDNASSIDLLIAGRRRGTTTAKGLLLMGAAVPVDPRFPALPHAAEEMQSVSKHFAASDVKSFSGPDATPHAYISSSPNHYKYIYLATHGTSNAVEPLESAIILSPDSQGSFKLFARDIMDQKLKLNADLVTISACEGAGTNVQSLEGLLGLEWAFMRAGAHQVVAALWNVDDAVTPKLMDDFYSELSKGTSTAEALRSAKRAMLHSGGFHSHPYYWAPLQLYTGS